MQQKKRINWPSISNANMRDKRGILSRPTPAPSSTCIQVVKFGILAVLLTSLCFFFLVSEHMLPRHTDSSAAVAPEHPKSVLEARLNQIAAAHGKAPNLYDPNSQASKEISNNKENIRTNSLTLVTNPPVSPSTSFGSVNTAASHETQTNSNSNNQLGNSGIVCPALIEPRPEFFDLPPFHKKNGSTDFHFIHIPKCGGTSMTAMLREVSCRMDRSRNNDCCTNPGFCDWHAFRRCGAIKGCINHFPQRQYIFKPYPSITIMREPVSRLLSAWFYRGHSPNLDFFQVRPYFKDINLGKLPKVVFEEYIEMPEYQNIQTRMLGADSFPYRNITVTDAVWCSAVEALNSIFFIGLQEAYDLSVEVLLRELKVEVDIPVLKERDQSNAGIARQKSAIKNNKPLVEKVRKINHYDDKLYQLGVLRFCKTTRKYPDLWEKLIKTTKVKCPDM
jgi:hypothetical protein